MGNSQLIRVLTDIGVTDISARGVSFQDGLFQARAIFQRHNYQLYQVHCPDEANPLRISTQTNLTLRVIRCLNDPESIQILKDMQERVVNLSQHKNLVRSYVMALVAEDYNEKQKAGLIGLPGLYKSVAGTTDYKNDTIQFILVEEDHLNMLQHSFFGPNQSPPGPNENLRQKFTLKQFMDRILPNSLLIDLFTEDHTTLYQLTIQSLEALAYLNEQGMTHQDLTPQSIIFELVSPYQTDQFGNFQQVSNPNSNDFHEKFRIKLGEYLNIKMLSDIAFQKTMLLQTQARMAQERVHSGGDSASQPNLNQVVKQIRENKQLYSQYDPPEKLKQNSIEMKAKGKNAKHLEDYDLHVKALKCDNQSSDIWSLGIIILEVFLSLFIHKKDCREMVHNLYLNKLSYQSRCIIINEILDNSKNPIFCSLIKEMLRDSESEGEDPSSPLMEEDLSLYEDLISKSNKPSNKRAAVRPTAAHLLSRNRIIHYFSYISDNKIDDKYLPSDINLLQVFSSNEMFVPMLVQCGMQNVLNKNKGIICFFTAMTVFIKTRSRPSITQLITHTLIQSKAHIQMIELLNFCMNSDLRQIMMFFNQNLVQSDFEDLDINESLFRSDFVEQKQAGLELLIHIIHLHEQDPEKCLFQLLQDYINAGLVPLTILLIQRIKNQKWMREKKYSSIKQEEIDDQMTEFTLQIIELMCSLGSQGHSRTFGAFIDKIEFFNHVCEVICSKKAASKDESRGKSLFNKAEMQRVLPGSNGKSFNERDHLVQRQEDHDSKPLRARRFSQKGPSPHDSQKGNALENQATELDEQQRPGAHSIGNNQGSMHRGHLQNRGQNFDDIDQASIDSEARKTALDEDKQDLTPEERLKLNQQKFGCRLFEFIIRCSECMSEVNLKKNIEMFDKSNHFDLLLRLLSCPAMSRIAQTCSPDFKKHITELLMRKFLNLHLKTNKTIGASSTLKVTQAKQNAQSSFNTSRTGLNNDPPVPLLSARAFGTTSNPVDGLNPAILSPTSRFQTQNDQQQRNKGKGPPSRTKQHPSSQADFLNQTYTSQKSHAKRSNQTPNPTNRGEAGPQNPSTQRANNLSQSERQLCQISRILKCYIDSSESMDRITGIIQECIDHQECISGKLQRIHMENQMSVMHAQQQAKKNKMSLERNKNRLDQESGLVRGEKKSARRLCREDRDQNQRRPGTTFSPINTGQPDQLQSSGTLTKDYEQTQTENNGAFLPSISNMRLFAPLFFQCCSTSCENQTFCLVCALKFHQDHKELNPYVCANSDELVCYTSILRESLDPGSDDLDYVNQSLLWNYEVDLYSRIESAQVIQAELNKNQKKKVQATQSMAKSSHNVAAMASASIPMSSRNRAKKNDKAPDSKLSSTGYDGGSAHAPASKMVEFEAILNFDLYDKSAVFVEGQDGSQPSCKAHFLTNDFDQHSLICSSPLEIPDRLGTARAYIDQNNIQQLIENYKQSYFEVKIHSGGFYDQIQVGLLFMLEKDIFTGRNSSSNVLNSMVNNSMIPGYEPLSIGYHGDDGKLYHNLSQNVCLETLILRASQDSEKLLQDADTDESLFDISNQVVYGGAYGPSFGAGDHVGCGIIPIQNPDARHFNKTDEDCAIYFTINGLKLPAIRFKSRGIKFFPVISMKGKLCHIEMIKSIQDYAFNRIRLRELEHQRFITHIRQNDKFQRSLTQFGQILNLKNRRVGASSGHHAVEAHTDLNEERDPAAGISNNLSERSKTRDRGRDSSKKRRGDPQSALSYTTNNLPRNAPQSLLKSIQQEVDLVEVQSRRPDDVNGLKNQTSTMMGGAKGQQRHLQTRSSMQRSDQRPVQVSGQGNVGPVQATGADVTEERRRIPALPPQSQTLLGPSGPGMADRKQVPLGAGNQRGYIQEPVQAQEQVDQRIYDQQMHHHQSQAMLHAHPTSAGLPAGGGPSYGQSLRTVQSVSKLLQNAQPNTVGQGSGPSGSFVQNLSATRRGGGGAARVGTKGGTKNFVKENRLKVSKSQAKF